MFRLFKKNTINKESSLNEEPKQAEKPSFFSRLKQSLGKTRDSFTSKLSSLFQGKNSLDEETLEELEAILIQADIGFDLSERFISNLKKDKAIAKDPNLAIDNLKNQLEAILAPVEKPLHLNSTNTPFVILMVGINGAGKTTSIAKLSKMFKAQGKSVLLAAGDTFRAAAVEQLQAWGQQEGVPVISQHQGADSASVIFDAYNSAKSKNIDVVLIDTAGRSNANINLMNELKKVIRISKSDLKIFVGDSLSGNDAVEQAENFNESVGIDGVILAKSDADEKGGTAISIGWVLKKPILFLGTGQSYDDLKEFSSNLILDNLGLN